MKRFLEHLYFRRRDYKPELQGYFPEELGYITDEQGYMQKTWLHYVTIWFQQKSYSLWIETAYNISEPKDNHFWEKVRHERKKITTI